MSDPTQADARSKLRIDWGLSALLKLVGEYQFDSVLDIGSGKSDAKKFMELFGKRVVSVDTFHEADYVGDFLEIDFAERFDAVWCSHVLEHQRNVGMFLDKIFQVLKDDGVLAIMVPIHPRNRLVSGHITSWSIPLLCYNLVMAGFDCRAAKILSNFELSLLVRKVEAHHPERVNSAAMGADTGREFEHLSKFFPVDVRQGSVFEERGAINWGDEQRYRLPRTALKGSTSALDIQCRHFRHGGFSPQIIVE